MIKEVKEKFILCLSKNLPKEISNYLSVPNFQLVDKIDDPGRKIDFIIVDPLTSNYKELDNTFEVLKKNIPLLSFSKVLRVNEFVTFNGKLIFDPMWLKDPVGKKMLDRFFGHETSLHLDEFFGHTAENYKTIKLTSHLNIGYYSDILTKFAFKNDFNFLSIRNVFESVVNFLTYLKFSKISGLPFEIEYGNNSNNFIIQFSASSSSFATEYIQNSINVENQNDPVKYQLYSCLRLCPFIDMYYLQSAGKIIITAIWNKLDQDEKFNFNVFSINQIKYSSQWQEELSNQAANVDLAINERSEVLEVELENKKLPGTLVKAVTIFEDEGELSLALIVSMAKHTENKWLEDEGKVERKLLTTLLLEKYLEDYPNKSLIEKLTDKNKEDILNLVKDEERLKQLWDEMYGAKEKLIENKTEQEEFINEMGVKIQAELTTLLEDLPKFSGNFDLNGEEHWVDGEGEDLGAKGSITIDGNEENKSDETIAVMSIVRVCIEENLKIDDLHGIVSKAIKRESIQLVSKNIVVFVLKKLNSKFKEKVADLLNESFAYFFNQLNSQRKNLTIEEFSKFKEGLALSLRKVLFEEEETKTVVKQVTENTKTDSEKIKGEEDVSSSSIKIKGEREEIIEGSAHVKGEKDEIVDGSISVKGEKNEIVEGSISVKGERNEIVKGSAHVKGEREEIIEGSAFIKGAREENDDFKQIINSDKSESLMQVNQINREKIEKIQSINGLTKYILNLITAESTYYLDLSTDYDLACEKLIKQVSIELGVDQNKVRSPVSNILKASRDRVGNGALSSMADRALGGSNTLAEIKLLREIKKRDFELNKLRKLLDEKCTQHQSFEEKESIRNKSLNKTFEDESKDRLVEVISIKRKLEESTSKKNWSQEDVDLVKKLTFLSAESIRNLKVSQLEGKKLKSQNAELENTNLEKNSKIREAESLVNKIREKNLELERTLDKDRDSFNSKIADLKNKLIEDKKFVSSEEFEKYMEQANLLKAQLEQLNHKKNLASDLENVGSHQQLGDSDRAMIDKLKHKNENYEKKVLELEKRIVDLGNKKEQDLQNAAKLAEDKLNIQQKSKAISEHQSDQVIKDLEGKLSDSEKKIKELMHKLKMAETLSAQNKKQPGQKTADPAADKKAKHFEKIATTAQEEAKKLNKVLTETKAETQKLKQDIQISKHENENLQREIAKLKRQIEEMPEVETPAKKAS